MFWAPWHQPKQNMRRRTSKTTGKIARYAPCVCGDGLVPHDAEHLLEGAEGGEAAPLAPPVVGGHAVLPAALDVEGGQVEAEVLARLLEQVVLHLGGHRVVQRLRNLQCQGKKGVVG